MASLRALADGGDLDRLIEALGHSPPTAPSDLLPLLSHVDRRVGQLALGWLAEHVPTCADPEQLQAWAKVLPSDLERWPPEAQPSLAQCYRRLARWGARLPDWHAAKLAPALALPWLVAALQTTPAVAVAAVGEGPLLSLALPAVKGARCDAPAALVQALVELGAPALRGPALRLLREAAKACAVHPSVVANVLLALVHAGHIESLAALNAPWARHVPLPRAVLREALADPHRSPAAVAVLAGRGDLELLVATARGEVPGPRANAVEVLGDHVTSLDELLVVAVADPLTFGVALRSAATRAHRRGVFATASDLPGLLAVYLCHRAWPADEFAALCHPARDALVELIAERPGDDPTWPRLLPVLAATEARGASSVIRAVLKGRPPAPIEVAALAAAAACGDSDAEGAILSALNRQPAKALAALELVGGPRTAKVLRGVLGIEPAGAVSPTLLPHLEAALTLLWQLTSPRSPAREELLDRLNPGELPRRIASDVAAERSSAARRLALNAALFVRPDQALVRLAALGEETTWDTLYGLLRETVVGLHDGTVPGDRPLDTAHTRGRPGIPSAVVEALVGYGDLLADRGRIRPPVIVGAKRPGDALLAELVLDLVLFGGMEAEMLPCLLAVVETLEAPHAVRRVHPLLRHRNPDVRGSAIRILVAQGGSALGFSIARLLRETDPVSLRPALDAVAHFGVQWAVPTVAACLEHPNMNIKKAAAQALGQLNPAGVVERLVFWLSHHDNPGLRALLNAAYDAARVGPGPLVRALEHADGRSTRLLLRALEGRLSAAHVRRLVVAGYPAAEPILVALAQGELSLADGTVDTLRVELHRYGLPEARRLPTRPDRRPAAVRALERLGWRLDRARAVLADPKAHGFLAAALRRHPEAWLVALDAFDPGERLALAPALQHLADRGAARRALPSLLRLLADVAPAPAAVEGVATLLGRIGAQAPAPVAGRIIDALRALPATAAGHGQLRWRTLAQLGATPTRPDLERALADAALTTDAQRDQRAVLAAALGSTGAADRSIDALVAAVQAKGALDLSALPGEPTARIAAIIDVFPHARAAHRPALIDAALVVQPLGVARWRSSQPKRRRLRARVDGPARLEALVHRLEAPEPIARREAAVALLDWGDALDGHLAVLDAFLAGRVEVPVDRQWVLADALERHPDRLVGAASLDLVEWLPLERRRTLLDRLWGRWEAGVHGAADSVRRLGAAFLLPRVAQAVAAGRVGAAELLTHGTLPRGPLLEGVVTRLSASGQAILAEDLRRRARPGPLGVPDAPAAPPPAQAPPDDQEALHAAARGRDRTAARTALTRLARDPDDKAIALFVELTQHADPGRRMVALRCLRRTADRAVYLDAARTFLDDPRPGVQRSVIRALAHARDEAALKHIVRLLRHRHAIVRGAAEKGLRVYGAMALPTLRKARSRARPDRRGIYEAVIEAIETGAPGRTTKPPRGR